MQVVADLHLHSRYSRAVSRRMDLTMMAKTAAEKGIDLLSAADWTHPVWFKEIAGQLVEKSSGMYGLKEGVSEIQAVRFLLGTEISSIYKQGDRIRRIHNLIFAPDFPAAEKISQALRKRGANLGSDGRPIVGLSSHDVLELVLNASEGVFLIPCHVWTPHFGLYGSASGFNSIEEAFGDLSQYIYGIETGLSSDPEMNWQVPELDDRSILSFSDAHSAPKMGREATVFELEQLSFPNLRSAINRHSGQQDKNHIVYTIEFYPEEGKYHYSGHRSCQVSLGPDQILEQGNSCPVCHRRLTEGVFFRVQQVAGKERLEHSQKKNNQAGLVWYTDPGHNHPPFVRLVQLLEIIAEVEGVGVGSKRVHKTYEEMIKILGPELHILLNMPLTDIETKAGGQIAEAIAKVRSNDIVIKPGFDGEYGIVKIWVDEAEKEQAARQNTPQMSLDI